ncbi:hypothetical protein [Acinetobacter nosocomialis]|uniref:hypothetical protein n=1 Tax=Acinetobacter nosocomialis TaxID=106654 RepID=UPI000665AE33|nr:hypothetical protein [Acinetobacter nosocomialis]
MTDLNKEREAFEKLSEIAEILNEEKSHFNGDFYDLPFNSCAESFINGAWYAWQEKAKAQAVPDQTINEIQSWIAVQSTQAMELDGEAFVVDANELAEFIEQLVKSESGAKR